MAAVVRTRGLTTVAIKGNGSSHQMHRGLALAEQPLSANDLLQHQQVQCRRQILGERFIMAGCCITTKPAPEACWRGGGGIKLQNLLKLQQITSQRLLDQSQAGVYRGKRHIPPHFRPIRVPYPKGLNC